MVNRGGIKKKSQIKALKTAAINTGKMSNNIANTDTVRSRTNAITLYPKKLESPKQISETKITATTLYTYCRPLSFVVIRNLFIVCSKCKLQLINLNPLLAHKDFIKIC